MINIYHVIAVNINLINGFVVKFDNVPSPIKTMDFILQHDWLHRGSEKGDFLTEEAIQRSNLRRIISGTFRDPLISDEDSDAERNNDIDTLLKNKHDKINKNNKESARLFVAGFRPLPLFPRQSSLSVTQHASGVRLLAESDPTITSFCINKASQSDKNIFKEIEEEYKKEEKEFREWAHREWVEKRCIRALRPMPALERMYEGDRSARVAMMASLPVHYEYAAQIKMSSDGDECQLEFVEDLKKVDVSKLPLLTVPAMDRLQSVAFPLPEQYIPRSCRQHPCRIVLPDENSTSSLPLREIQTQLAKYAANQKAKCIISEKALRSLVHTNSEWNLPLTVENIYTAEGMSTVVVVDSEVHPNKELTRARTAKALNLLLRHHLTRNNQSQSEATQSNDVMREEINITAKEKNINSDSDSEDDQRMCIDMGGGEEDDKVDNTIRSPSPVEEQTDKNLHAKIKSTPTFTHKDKQLLIEGSHLLDTQCTCKGTPFESPPHVSYKKWLLKNKDGDTIPIIVYTSHKTKTIKGKEVIINAIPEYQIELGASTVPVDKLRTLALALRLRQNSQLLSARIDATNGHIVTVQYTEESMLLPELGDEPDTDRKLTEEAVNMIYDTVSQLCMLMPNRYILNHQPQHGENALLFVSTARGPRPLHALSLHTLSLTVDDSCREDKERSDLQIPPILSRALLPVHKIRKLLPLAFSPYPSHKKLAPSKHDKKMAAAAELKKKKNAKKRANQKLRKKNRKK